MQRLKHNIINILNEQGQQWFEKLPLIVQDLSNYWNLSTISPVDNMSFNYVMKAMQNKNSPVVVKIAPDETFIADEIKTLKCIDGHGTVRLLDYHEKYHSALLQQATPGHSLKSIYPAQEEYVMDSYITAMKQMHKKSCNITTGFQHISDWLKAIDKTSSKKIPPKLLNQARRLKEDLLRTSQNEHLLHGDLHHDNIIKDASNWIIIDPK